MLKKYRVKTSQPILLFPLNKSFQGAHHLQQQAVETISNGIKTPTVLTTHASP